MNEFRKHIDPLFDAATRMNDDFQSTWRTQGEQAVAAYARMAEIGAAMASEWMHYSVDVAERAVKAKDPMELAASQSEGAVRFANTLAERTQGLMEAMVQKPAAKGGTEPSA